MMNFDEKLTILNIFSENNEKFLVIFGEKAEGGDHYNFQKNFQKFWAKT